MAAEAGGARGEKGERTIVSSNTGSRCLLVTRVSGASLVPSPPAKTMPFIDTSLFWNSNDIRARPERQTNFHARTSSSSRRCDRLALLCGFSLCGLCSLRLCGSWRLCAKRRINHEANLSRADHSSLPDIHYRPRPAPAQAPPEDGGVDVNGYQADGNDQR